MNIMKKNFLILVSFSIISNYLYSKEEIILQMKLGNKLNYVEGYLDSENGDIYVDKNEFLSFIEAPEKEKNLINSFPQNDSMLNISRLNNEKIIKFNKFQWDENETSLDIDTVWETQEKKEEQIIKNRERLDYNRRLDKNKNVERENWKLITPGMLNIGFLKEDFTKNSEERIYFNYTNNLFYGNFNLSGDIQKKNSKIDYFFWQRDLINERKVVVGNFYRNSTFNFGKNGQVTGIQFLEKNSWSSNSQVNSKRIVGFAPTGSVVELFVNNILKEYQVVQNGEYSFNIDLNNGSNEYLIKKYGVDGAVSEEKISLYGSEKILKKGDFDYVGSFGKLKADGDGHNVFDGQIKYGLFDNFTFNMGGFNAIDNKNRVSNFFTLSEVGSFNIPYIDLPILEEAHFSSDMENSFAYRYKIESNLYETNFSFFSENYQKLNVELKNTISRVKNSEFQISRQLFSVNTRFGYNSSVDKFDTKWNELYLNLGKSFKNIYANTGIRRSIFERGNTKNNTSYTLGVSYNFTNNFSKYVDSISLDTDTNKSGTNYNVNLGKSSFEGEFSYNFSYSYNEKFKDRYGLTISYTPGKVVGIRSSVYANNGAIERISSGIETTVSMGAKEPIIGYDNFLGKGNIIGKSFIDKNGDGEFNGEDEWISSNVKVDSAEITTKNNKEYRIMGVQTYKSTQITGELNGDDVPYNTEANLKRVVQLNPGGLMKIDLPFRLMVTVVSTINFEDNPYYEEVTNILSKLKIQFLNTKTREKVIFNWLDDSLFIADLSVGEYEVSLIYPQNAEIKVTMKTQIVKVVNKDSIDISFNVVKDSKNNFNIFLQN